MHGQDQKCEQKHTTKNFVEFHNHSLSTNDQRTQQPIRTYVMYSVFRTETSLTYFEKGRPYMPAWTISRTCKKHRYLEIITKCMWSLPSSYIITQLPLIWSRELNNTSLFNYFTIATSFTLGAQISVVESSSMVNVFRSFTQLYWAHLSLGLIYQTRRIVYDQISKHEERFENTTRSGVFLTNFQVFGNTIKHCLECSISLLCRN